MPSEIMMNTSNTGSTTNPIGDGSMTETKPVLSQQQNHQLQNQYLPCNITNYTSSIPIRQWRNSNRDKEERKSVFKQT